MSEPAGGLGSNRICANASTSWRRNWCSRVRLPDWRTVCAAGRTGRRAGLPSKPLVIAAELAAHTGSAEPSSAVLEEVLRQGIARLQEALEREAAGAADPSLLVWEPEPSPPAGNSLAQDPELVRDFVVETREHLASVENRMLVLEKNPGDAEAIHSVFRGFHTIKGLAGFLELTGDPGGCPRGGDAARPGAQREARHHGGGGRRDSRKRGLPETGGQGCGSGSRRRSSRGRPPTPKRCVCGSPRRRGLAMPAAGEAPAGKAPAPQAEAAPAESRTAAPEGKTADALSVRVDTGKLDYLMDMVGRNGDRPIAGAAQSGVSRRPAIPAC